MELCNLNNFWDAKQRLNWRGLRWNVGRPGRRSY